MMAHSLTIYRNSQNHVLCILTVVLMLMPLFSASAQTSESSPNRVISEIQRLLNTNGCASMSVNGELNSETVEALNEYLRIKGLNDITALSADELLTMLLSEDRAACLSTEPNLPSTNQITAQIQERLNELNCNAGSVDGISGRQTVEAIRRILAANLGSSFNDPASLSSDLNFLDWVNNPISACTNLPRATSNTPSIMGGVTRAEARAHITRRWAVSLECPETNDAVQGYISIYNSAQNFNLELDNNTVRNGIVNVDYQIGSADLDISLTDGRRWKATIYFAGSNGYLGDSDQPWVGHFQGQDVFGCNIYGSYRHRP